MTTSGSPDFVKPEERIAVFDNDGTLWSEQPFYFQAVFAFDRIRVMAPDHPAWKTTEPYLSVIAGEMRGGIAPEQVVGSSGVVRYALRDTRRC